MAEEAKYILQTYGRAPVVISHGKGAKMYDVEGKEYIDMAAGIAVNALGHSDSRWFAALVEQAEKLSHTSNLYHTVPQVSRAAKALVGFGRPSPCTHDRCTAARVCGCVRPQARPPQSQRSLGAAFGACARCCQPAAALALV